VRQERVTRKTRRNCWPALVAILSVSGLPASAAEGSLEGIWCWGTQFHAEATPFLRIARSGGQWRLETKHYMHDEFVAGIKDVRIDGSHLAFTYWYEPLSRWATCSLDLMQDRLVGQCDGERNAHEWGVTPVFLWRSRVPEN
jgi:hypothetical protein